MFRKFNSWFKSEKGFSTAAIFILGVPLLVGAFGLAFDSVRLVYIQQYIQGRADLATQAAVNVAYTNATDKKVYLGNPVGGEAASTVTATTLYDTNTSSKRRANGGYDGFLVSAGGDYGTPVAEVIGEPLTGAQLCNQTDLTPKYGVKMVVKEQIPATFLNIIGIHSFDMDIVSSSWVRGKTC